jgi:hypothetical protein
LIQPDSLYLVERLRQGFILALVCIRLDWAGRDAPSWADQHHRLPKYLTKREIKCLNAKIEELDFEGSVYDSPFLPDELIEFCGLWASPRISTDIAARVY